MTSSSSKPILEPFDEHNQKLISHVHPHDWVNPEPIDRYHLVVVGAGTGGWVSAASAAGLGAKVALVERHFMGGDCLNVGCVPSKGLISAARVWQTAKTAHGEMAGPDIQSEGDFAAVMERMRRLRAGISPVDGAGRFRDLGIDVFLGQGRFVAGDTVEVDGKRLRFRRAVIATGARAAAPPIEGLSKTPHLTNETLFSLTELPARLGVVGAGPIGCEMAQTFARFGSKVTVLNRSAHVLPREDEDAGRLVEAAMRRDGVEIHGKTDVVAVKATKDGQVVVSAKSGEQVSEIEVDQLLVAVGRAPNTNGLGLEAAGVEYNAKGVTVDDRMRTTNKRIFAVGDIASKFKFTHTADAQARMVIRNAFFFGRGKASALVVPWCTYTSPEVAHVGLFAHDAKEQGYEVETMTLPFDELDRAVLDGESDGFLRIHLKKGSDTILGGTLVAAHAGDMIGPLALAATHGLGLSSFSSTIFPYPTQGEIFRKAGDQYNRRRLTDTTRKIFDLWFKIFK